MRVLLLDKEKITKITLPDEIDGVFLMSYLPVGSKVTKELSIEAENDKWIIKSNGSINVIVDNHISEKIELENYLHVKVRIEGKNELLDLYCLPTIEVNKYKLAVNSEQITIGSNPNSSIIYGDVSIKDTHAGIYRQQGIWYIAIPEGAQDCPVYLNDVIIKSRKKIKVGDVIFINGLKAVWMGNFIQINNPQNRISVNTRIMTNYIEEDIDNSKYDPVTEEDASIELYKPEDYFFHTPSLREYVVDEEVVIDAPPQSQKSKEDSLLQTFAASFTMLASSFVSAINLINNISTGAKPITLITSTVMFVSMLLGSIILPRLVSKLQKKNEEKKEKLRIMKYSAYVNSRDQYIQQIMTKQQQILRETNININECANLITSGTRTIWNKEIKDDDFLIIRLGMGNVPAKININAPQEHFTLEDDELLQIVYDIQNRSRVLEDVPVTFNFSKNRVSAIITDVNYGYHFVNSVLLQIATLHSAQDVKLCFFINENLDQDDYWSFAKFLPHTFSNDKQTRFYSETYDEMKILSTILEKELKERKESTKGKENEFGDIVDDSKLFRKFDTYYILVTNDVMAAKSLPIFDQLMEEPENYGFSVIYVDKNMNKLPKRCNSFIALSENSGCVMEKDLNSQTLFTPEYNPNLDLRALAGKLMNIPLMATDIESSLPTAINFLQMYNVSKIEQLNITNRWKTNDPTMSLAAPIGVHTSGELFMLDLHEKKHGPHGLIAGATGSGKSEFIITFVLTMAVNYHPDEVQFVLIDYKGGGLAGAFENRERGVAIPHIAGTITNLDQAEMNRSLVSINSELKRREQMFMDARDETGESTLDIYKYQKYYRQGIVKEPMSHLFIVSDEFAELKAQQPEFMSELVSTARVGRSLGVHLILATQKPSGVVNDQIWSNSKFKICLKVQTAADSSEMLKRPDAASIKETGRFYLKVGYDEYFDIGQSAWAGAKYIPSDRIIKKVDDSLNFINNVGSITKTIEDYVKVENSKEQGDQLTNIVRYLEAIAEKENYKNRRLWLEPIPENIYLANIRQKYNYKAEPFKINPVIGEYDYPAKQKQGLLTLDLNKGNAYVFGKNGAGKEDFISTLIYSICIDHSPKEVNIYVVDMGAGTLRQFIKYPQVADVCTLDDGDKIIDLMALAEREIQRRKEITVDFGGNYDSYNEMNPDNKLPLHLVIINNLDIFTENFGKIAELIQTLYRDGAKYGVVFVLTVVGVSTLRVKTREYFPNHISMQLANKDDYLGTLDYCPRRFEPAAYKGRGIIDMDKVACEFQSALIYTRNEINKIIKQTQEKLSETYKDCALTGLPSVPKVVNVENLIDDVQELNHMPIGYNAETKEKYYYNFESKKANIISAMDFTDHLPFLNAMAIEFRKLTEFNYDVQIIDFSNYFDILNIGLTCYQNNFNDILGKIITESDKIEKETIYVITGINKLKDTIDPQNMPFVNKFFIDTLKMPKLHFIFIETYDDLNSLRLEEWYQKIVDPNYGIWLGPNVGGQMIIKFKNLSPDDRAINNPDYAIVSENGKRKIIKRVIVKMEEEEEDGE